MSKSTSGPKKKNVTRKTKSQRKGKSSSVFSSGPGGLDFIETEFRRQNRNREKAIIQVFVDKMQKTFRETNDEEMHVLEASNLIRLANLKRRVMSQSYAVEDVAKLLGTTRQTPHDRVLAGSLLAFKEKGQLWFPQWQFDPLAPDSVIAGLSKILSQLDLPDFVKCAWFITPSPALDGESPIDVLRRGDIERVVRLARSVGATAA